MKPNLNRFFLFGAYGSDSPDRSESNATAAAESAGITVRIARRNGRSVMLHGDLRPSRVSLTVENGIVARVSVG